MEKKLFMEFTRNEGRKYRGWVLSLAIFGYIRFVLIIILSLAMPEQFGEIQYAIFDALLSLGLGIWIHKTFAKVPVVIFGVYIVLSMLINMMSSGTMSGIIWVVLCVNGVMQTFKLHDDWEIYKKDHPELFNGNDGNMGSNADSGNLGTGM